MLRKIVTIGSMLLAFCLSAVVLLVVAAFIYENSTWVLIRTPFVGDSLGAPLNWVEYEAHQGALVVASFALGAMVLQCVYLPAYLLRRKDIRHLRRVIESLEFEMAQICDRYSLAREESERNAGQ